MTDPITIWYIKIEFPKDKKQLDILSKKWEEWKKKRKSDKDKLIADMLKNSPSTSYIN